MDFAAVPIGFAMALAQNEKTVNACAMMAKAQKNTIPTKARGARSEKEMLRIANSIPAMLC